MHTTQRRHAETVTHGIGNRRWRRQGPDDGLAPSSDDVTHVWWYTTSPPATTRRLVGRTKLKRSNRHFPHCNFWNQFEIFYYLLCFVIVRRRHPGCVMEESRDTVRFAPWPVHGHESPAVPALYYRVAVDRRPGWMKNGPRDDVNPVTMRGAAGRGRGVDDDKWRTAAAIAPLS